MNPVNNDNLTAAFVDRAVILRVEGRGSFKLAPSLKKFLRKLIDEQKVDRILLDMSGCLGMDSTFMGVLAGLAGFVRRESPDTVFRLVSLSEKNEKLLRTLGVDRVVDYAAAPSPEDRALMERTETARTALKNDVSDRLDTATTTLEAHQTLVDINPDNLAKFESVLELLQEDVRNLANPD